MESNGPDRGEEILAPPRREELLALFSVKGLEVSPPQNVVLPAGNQRAAGRGVHQGGYTLGVEVRLRGDNSRRGSARAKVCLGRLRPGSLQEGHTWAQGEEEPGRIHEVNIPNRGVPRQHHGRGESGVRNGLQGVTGSRTISHDQAVEMEAESGSSSSFP